MKKFKIITLSILMFSCLLLITGCIKKKEVAKDTDEKVFTVEQVSDKNIKATLKNATKNDEKTAKLVIEEGENIISDSKFEGISGVTVYYFKAGTKHDKNNADSELLNGEGNSTTEGFPAGEYDVVIEVAESNTTGTFELTVK